MSHTMLDDDVVAAAINLAPSIRAACDAEEDMRQVPPAVVRAIADTGLFQRHLPQSMGGPEMPPLTAFRAVEELSKINGSVGWCTMIAGGISLLTGWLPADVGREIFGQPPDVRLAGSARPEGRAYPVKGGYRVKGRWDFASGIDHANWLHCTCIVMAGDAPRLTANGAPETRALLVPAQAAKIEDTWSVVGLCGTGSKDFIVDDVFVPTTYRKLCQQIMKLRSGSHPSL